MTAKQRVALLVALVLIWLGSLVLRVSPRVGVRLVRWAAGLRYQGDPERAVLRAEELAALVDDRPGRLSKLLTGLGFALHALTVEGLRRGPAGLRRLAGGAVRFARQHRVGVATAVGWVWGTLVGLGGGIAVVYLRGGGGRGINWILLNPLVAPEVAGRLPGVGLVVRLVVGSVAMVVAGVGALGLARVMGVRQVEDMGGLMWFTITGSYGAAMLGLAAAGAGDIQGWYQWMIMFAPWMVSVFPILWIQRGIEARAKGRAISGHDSSGADS